MADYVAPKLGLDGFNCPHCDAFAHQRTYRYLLKGETRGSWEPFDGFVAMQCVRCQQYSVWRVANEQMLYPAISPVPLPTINMPEDVAADYREARDVYGRSARAAGAILRLAIQKLCVQLGKPGKNLNDDIGALVREGLPVRVQQALDVVRVIGNNAVHPGEIDLRDDPDLVGRMFALVNLIVDVMITQPRAVEAMFENLPEGARRGIESRDKRE